MTNPSQYLQEEAEAEAFIEREHAGADKYLHDEWRHYAIGDEARALVRGAWTERGRLAEEHARSVNLTLRALGFGATGEQTVQHDITAHGVTVKAGTPLLLLVERIGAQKAEIADLHDERPAISKAHTAFFVGAERTGSTSPEYLEELADIADSDSLWKLPLMQQLDLPENKRRQLDAGVALRRHASHIRDLRALLAAKRSLLITPLSENSTAVKSIDTPPDHARSRDARSARPCDAYPGCNASNCLGCGEKDDAGVRDRAEVEASRQRSAVGTEAGDRDSFDAFILRRFGEEQHGVSPVAYGWMLETWGAARTLDTEPAAWQDPDCPRHVISAEDMRNFTQPVRNGPVTIANAKKHTRPLYAHSPPEQSDTVRPFGCVLAMRVLQSDLYKQLDDDERAQCDELVQRNLEWFKRDSTGTDGVREDGNG